MRSTPGFNKLSPNGKAGFDPFRLNGQVGFDELSPNGYGGFDTFSPNGGMSFERPVLNGGRRWMHRDSAQLTGRQVFRQTGPPLPERTRATHRLQPSMFIEAMAIRPRPPSTSRSTPVT